MFAKALEQLGVRNVVLGHSWGTLVAIALALQSEYAVSGLVLASGYYFPTFRMDFWLMSAPAVPLFGDLMRYTISPVISWAMLPKLIRTLFAPRAVPPEFKNEFPILLSLRPKQLRAAAEESAFLIPVAAQLQLQYQGNDMGVLDNLVALERDPKKESQCGDYLVEGRHADTARRQMQLVAAHVLEARRIR